MQPASEENLLLGRFRWAADRHRHRKPTSFCRRVTSIHIPHPRFRTASPTGFQRSLTPFGLSRLQNSTCLRLPGGRRKAHGMAWEPASRRGFILYQGEGRRAIRTLLHSDLPASRMPLQCRMFTPVISRRKNYDPGIRHLRQRWPAPEWACQSCHGPAYRPPGTWALMEKSLEQTKSRSKQSDREGLQRQPEYLPLRRGGSLCRCQ